LSGVGDREHGLPAVRAKEGDHPRFLTCTEPVGRGESREQHKGESPAS
jgi:hypothetical protein